MITTLESELDFQIIAHAVISAIGITILLYQLIKSLWIPLRRKIKIKYDSLIGWSFFGIVISVMGISGLNSWFQLTTHQCKTIGTTTYVKYSSKGGPSVRFRYTVNGKTYVGSSSTYPVDINDITIPDGKYPIIYECDNPGNSKMDFFKIKKE